ncbi:hypothetical protein [Desulfurococcus sp.]
MKTHTGIRRKYRLTPLTPLVNKGLHYRICGRGCIIPVNASSYYSFI